MQRLIKFRAYDTKNKKWLDEVLPEEYMLDNDDCWDAPDYGEMCEALSFYPHSPLGPDFNGRIVYQQFTGLLDKNGKEIYEGDIVEQVDHSDFSITYGRDGKLDPVYPIGWKFEVKYTRYKISPFDLSAEKDFEVIGNIFETPELLK